MNTDFNNSDDCIETKLKYTIYYIYLPGVLELQVDYSNGDISWYPINLVKYEDPHNVTNYGRRNNLGKVYNSVHNRCANLFLRSLNYTIRRLRCSNM